MHILLKCEESSNFTIGLLPFLSVISESNKKPVAKKESERNRQLQCENVDRQNLMVVCRMT